MKIKNSHPGRRRGLPPVKNPQNVGKPRLNPCVGAKLKLLDRNEKCGPCDSSCRGKCRHRSHVSPAAPTFKAAAAAASSSKQHDDWISEHFYRKYTETDSRPTSPDIFQHRSRIKSRRGGDSSSRQRKCLTPEPSDSTTCHVHHRRVLILDLRKVKSVDVSGRQDSLSSTTTCSVVEGDEEHVTTRSSAKLFSTTSSSITPKTKRVLKRRFRKPELPVEYERSTSPKILEGLIFPPLHSSVLALLSQRSTSGNQTLRVGTGQQGLGVSVPKQKLRRHGRRRKNESQEKLAKDEEGDVQERPVTGGDKEITPEQEGTSPDKNEDEEPTCYGSGQQQQLYQILDETLSKTRWYLTDEKMKNEIEELEKVLGKTNDKKRLLGEMNLTDDLHFLSLLPNPRKKRIASLSVVN